tara:strand:- start:82 stop:585 length:504 start_codon:yes stop_codon:yes gene_type:complete
MRESNTFQPNTRSTKWLRKKRLVVGAIIIAGLGFVWYAVDDAIVNARLQASKGFVRSHLQALMVYAGNHQDQLPGADQWPEVLIRDGIIDGYLMVAPSGTIGEFSYCYVPGDQIFRGDSSRIRIYENPKHWKYGVIVGFEDGHTEFLPHSEFKRMLADQLASEPVAP